MSDITHHDAGRDGLYPTRTYRCSTCEALHQYKRPYGDIPEESPCCGVALHRAYDVDNMPGFVMATPIREVRHKLRQEEREGKRVRAIDREMNPHIATV